MKNLSPEEAVRILENMKVKFPVPRAAETQIKRNAALEMAIKALATDINVGDKDTISRKAVTAAIEKCHKKCCREDANGDEWIHYETTLNEVESIPPAPKNDAICISRQAAIEAVMECYDNDELFEVYEDKLRELPPAQPESDSGRWERHYSRPGVYADLCWHCSKCGYKTDYQYANVNHHYCPNCGRKMEREVTECLIGLKEQ